MIMMNLDDARHWLEALCDAWSDITNYSLTETGRLTAKKLIKQFGLDACLSAIEKSVSYLSVGDDIYTADSVNLAWSKIGGICKMDSLPEWKQRLYHIRNIARQRSGEDWYPQTGAEILALFEEAYNEGDSLDQLEDLARRGIGYRELPDVLRDWIRQSKQERAKQAKAERQAAESSKDRERRAVAVHDLCPEFPFNANAVDFLQETGDMVF